MIDKNRYRRPCATILGYKRRLLTLLEGGEVRKCVGSLFGQSIRRFDSPVDCCCFLGAIDLVTGWHPALAEDGDSGGRLALQEESRRVLKNNGITDWRLSAWSDRNDLSFPEMAAVLREGWGMEKSA